MAGVGIKHVHAGLILNENEVVKSSEHTVHTVGEEGRDAVASKAAKVPRFVDHEGAIRRAKNVDQRRRVKIDVAGVQGTKRARGSIDGQNGGAGHRTGRGPGPRTGTGASRPFARTILPSASTTPTPSSRCNRSTPVDGNANPLTRRVFMPPPPTPTAEAMRWDLGQGLLQTVVRCAATTQQLHLRSSRATGRVSRVASF